MNSVLLIAEIRIEPDRRTEFETAARRLAAAAVTEDGVTGYALARSITEPDAYVFTERYRDADALQAHLESAATKEFLTELPRWLAERARIRVYHTGEPDESTIDPDRS